MSNSSKSKYFVKVTVDVEVIAESKEDAIEKAKDVVLYGEGGDVGIYDAEIEGEQEI